MSRYLTPQTISLLILVGMYCDGYVPSIATIPVLSFVTSQLLPISGAKTVKGLPKASKISCLSLDDLKTLLEDTRTRNQKRSLWDTFLIEIAKINDINSLFEFFSVLGCLFEPRGPTNKGTEQLDEPNYEAILSPSSFVGIFVRRARLEFERLHFHDVMTLARDFEMYRQAFLEASGPAPIIGDDDGSLKLMNEMSGGKISAIINGSLDGSVYASRSSSSYQTERVLTFQIEQIERFGVRLPPEMKAYLEESTGDLQRHPKLSYYYRFLDAWCGGDFHSAFENLHRHYDYAMQNKDRSQYQYALLNMAILQADFGCFGEALAAINETIATARENKDMSCLNFSLSWLYNFRVAHPHEHEKEFQRWMLGTERETLNYIRNKAAESGLWNLMSTNLLNEVKFHLAKGENPRIAFERVMESSHMNVTYSLTNLTGPQLFIQSSILARLGVANLATSYSRLVADCHGPDSSAEVILKAQCRSAFTCVCAGDYENANKMLDAARSDRRLTVKLMQYLSATDSMLKLKRALHNHDLRAAENLVEGLQSVGSVDPDLHFEISMLQLDLLMRRQAFSDAYSLVDTLTSQAERDSADISRRMRLLSTKALLFAKCGRPQKGLSVSLRAAAAGCRSKALLPLWQAIGALGTVVNGLREHEAARALVESVVYQALESEDLTILALLQSVLANACMGLAGQLRGKDETRMREALKSTLRWIEAARNSYHTLEDVMGESEMLEKASIVLELLQDKT